MRGQVVSPAPRDAWGQVLAEDPGATVYQTLAWFDAARQVSGASDVSRLYTLDDGRRLVLPLLRRTPAAWAAPGPFVPHRLWAGRVARDRGVTAVGRAGGADRSGQVPVDEHSDRRQP